MFGEERIVNLRVWCEECVDGIMHTHTPTAVPQKVQPRCYDHGYPRPSSPVYDEGGEG